MKWNKDIEVYNEDNMITMSRYPDNHFDLAVVDPPYGIGMAKWDIKPPSPKYFLELFRVSKNQIIFGGNYFNLPITQSWICWHKTSKFKKRALAGQSDFELAWTSFEMKARLIPYTYSGNIKGLTKLHTDYTQKRIHPTEKPAELYRILLKEYAKENFKILDTHLGSGSNAVAIANMNKIENMNLSLVAAELDTEYFNTSKKRFDLKTSQGSLFAPAA